MTLIEAVKSGKKMRRPTDWGIKYSYQNFNSFSREDVLANDWEIDETEPEKITVTADQVKDAIYSLKNELGIKTFLKALGFKEM